VKTAAAVRVACSHRLPLLAKPVAA